MSALWWSHHRACLLRLTNSVSKSTHLIIREYLSHKEKEKGHRFSIYDIPERQQLKGRHNAGRGGGSCEGGGFDSKGAGGSIGRSWKEAASVVSEVIRLHTPVKTPRPSHLKWVNLTVYSLCLSAPAFKCIFLPWVARTAWLTGGAVLVGTRVYVFLKAVI